MAISAAAAAVANDATLAQRRTRPDNWITFERSARELSAAGGASASTAATGGEGGGASGSAIGACGPEWPTAAQIFSHTIGRGSTEPTIWLSTPSRYSQAWTMPV